HEWRPEAGNTNPNTVRGFSMRSSYSLWHVICQASERPSLTYFFHRVDEARQPSIYRTARVQLFDADPYWLGYSTLLRHPPYRLRVEVGNGRHLVLRVEGRRDVALPARARRGPRRLRHGWNAHRLPRIHSESSQPFLDVVELFSP